MGDGPMKDLYMKRKRSVYRNFVHTEREITENILYFTVIGKTEEVQDVCEGLASQPYAGLLRMEYDTFECPEGVLLLRIYSAKATREKMIARLKDYVSADKIIKFGKEESWADQSIACAGDDMVKHLRDIYEPVSIKGWRNMIRI